MRIGHYAKHLWTPGGIRTYVRRLGMAQNARGHTVMYLSNEVESGSPFNPDTCHTINEESVVACANDFDLDVLHLHTAAPLPTISYSGSAAVSVVRTMHGHQASCPSGSRYLSRQSAPCNRTPSRLGCLFGHVVDGCGSRRPHRIAEHFHRFDTEVKLVKQIVTLPVSRFLRDRMIEAGCPSEQMRVIPSPAPTVPTTAPMDVNGLARFLYIGRLTPEKGILWLIRAFARTNTPAHLDVAGDGALLSTARKLASQLGISERVTFHGWVSAAKIAALMEVSRAVVFPSVWHEPAGLVSLEAASYGRALIASRVGGIPEYARKGHALLVSPNDVDELAQAIMRLADHPVLAACMGRVGQTVIAPQFSMDGFLDTLEDVYKYVVHASTEAQLFSTSLS